ncbi:MAG: hypothetical protein M3154_09495 [Candidatus Eremiobacteraeota bacterium]|nr:hypothetical protein [Candidatus Eremiobacteraeota bacterium]
MTVTAKAPNGKENTTEYAIGTVRGWNYWSAYTRAAAVPADPAALTELTAFCADTTQ